MDCIDFSTNKIMRPFGAAKGKARPVAPPRDTRAIIKIPAMPKQMPIAGGVKLIPRVSPAFPSPSGNPFTDIKLRQSPATANARNAVKTPDGRLLQFFR
jgi:hypothetical protein